MFAKKRPYSNIAIDRDMCSDSFFAGYSAYRYILLYLNVGVFSQAPVSTDCSAPGLAITFDRSAEHIEGITSRNERDWELMRFASVTFPNSSSHLAAQ